MIAPDDLKYTKEHEWVKVSGKNAIIGVTDYAQEQLGDIVYAELPEDGEEIAKGETFGALESVKAVSDCFAPVSGRVVESNNLLGDSPETINEDCYGEGWIIKMEMQDPTEVDELMDHDEYKSFVEEETA